MTTISWLKPELLRELTGVIQVTKGDQLLPQNLSVNITPARKSLIEKSRFYLKRLPWK